MSECDVVISYSDCEDGDARVGVAIGSNRLTLPEAGVLNVLVDPGGSCHTKQKWQNNQTPRAKQTPRVTSKQSQNAQKQYKNGEKQYRKHGKTVTWGGARFALAPHFMVFACFGIVFRHFGIVFVHCDIVSSHLGLFWGHLGDVFCLSLGVCLFCHFGLGWRKPLGANVESLG